MELAEVRENAFAMLLTDPPIQKGLCRFYNHELSSRTTATSMI